MDLITPLLIFGARLCDVSLGTLRTIAVVRGKTVNAWIFGLLEILIWLMAISRVLTTLQTNVLNLVAYAIGFATGNVVGIMIERRLAMGNEVIRVISRSKGAEIARVLRKMGQGVTEFEGKGKDGPVTMLYIIAARTDVPEVLKRTREVDPECITILADVKTTSLRIRSFTAPTGWRAVVKKK
ncbi:hypothetical protein AMJ40_01265 [candidate division TA06 bacterium DG_26]|uniref:UPF0316 protein AMJ40_01265 n=1 Tax=candidate division TA06 bacterium DG_26 TaxID=1703771 RepID=A0A0S7WLU9_UNCT6|nr:MAG: hypothetical protein AMJ40_01265 [candidate division TA06 bacterium DG_26]